MISRGRMEWYDVRGELRSETWMDESKGQDM